jgi:hypothetical protein
MKRKTIIFAVLAACSSYAVGQGATAQSAVKTTTYQIQSGGALQLPTNMYFGEVATGLALNSKGNVFIFHRGNSAGPAYAATAAQLLEFDTNGKFICIPGLLRTRFGSTRTTTFGQSIKGPVRS